MGCSHGTGVTPRTAGAIVTTVAEPNVVRKAAVKAPARPSSRHSTSSDTSTSRAAQAALMQLHLAQSRLNIPRDFDSMSSSPSNEGNRGPQPPDVELTRRHAVALEQKLKQIQQCPKTFYRAVLLRRQLAFPEASECRRTSNAQQQSLLGSSVGLQERHEDSASSSRATRIMMRL
mmetsp:Transcript_4326/g.10629  ORF Transcript_4326/g.10629 Transcript_4326/m.10629 type:complete len:175 (-) Transcript_4326:101-625(-)